MEHTSSIPRYLLTTLVGVNLLLGALPVLAAKKAAPAPPPASVPSPEVSFSYPAFTSVRANPSVSGNADNLRGPLVLSVIDRKGTFVYMGVVATTSGPWSKVLYPSLAPGAYRLSLFTGTSTFAQAQLMVSPGGPQFSRDFSLGAFDVSDGKLMRFSVTGGAGGTSLGQLTFSVVPQSSSLGSVTLYGFTDPSYSHAIVPGTDGTIASVPFDPASPLVAIDPTPPLFIPPGATYYLELDGAVVPGDTSYSVTAQLLGDSWLDHGAPFAVLASSSNLVWSPNSFGSTTVEDADWLNGSTIPTLYPLGLTEERYATPTLGCDMSVSTSSISAAMPVTIAWDSSGASNAAWAGGGLTGPANLTGSVTVIASSTRTFILSFWGPLGATQCYTTVYFGQAIATQTTATSTAASTTPLGTLAASPTSGVVPLTTTLSGTINNNSSCSASTYTLGFGDKSTTTIAVSKSVCKPQAYSISHRYGVVGTYIAKLYLGTFAAGTTTTLVASTTITVTATKVGIAQTALVANALSAFDSAWGVLVRLLAAFFER